MAIEDVDFELPRLSWAEMMSIRQPLCMEYLAEIGRVELLDSVAWCERRCVILRNAENSWSQL